MVMVPHSLQTKICKALRENGPLTMIQIRGIVSRSIPADIAVRAAKSRITTQCRSQHRTTPASHYTVAHLVKIGKAARVSVCVGQLYKSGVIERVALSTYQLRNG